MPRVHARPRVRTDRRYLEAAESYERPSASTRLAQLQRSLAQVWMAAGEPPARSVRRARARYGPTTRTCASVWRRCTRACDYGAAELLEPVFGGAALDDEGLFTLFTLCLKPPAALAR
jgi:hypothetical protein